jgi:ABC-type branched-subunit amino acid transport system ATPase component
MTTQALECENLTAGYGSLVVVRDVSLSVADGETFALLGKNGMGKSTFLKALMGLVTRNATKLSLVGHDCSRESPHRIARKGVAYVSQESPLFDGMTVEENLRLGALGGSQLRDGLPMVRSLFPVLGERMKQKAGTLSGGERKMLLLARSFLSRPKLILLDEVTEGLQPSMVGTVGNAISAYRDDTGAAIVLVEQNLGMALDIADRFAVLTGGAIADQGELGDGADLERIERHMTLWQAEPAT